MTVQLKRKNMMKKKMSSGEKTVIITNISINIMKIVN